MDAEGPAGELRATHPPLRVPGTAVFMTGNPEGTPPALLHNLKHNKVLHEQVVLLTIVSEDVPHVPPEERVEVEQLEQGFVRVIARYGFMENPSIPDILKRGREQGLQFQLMEHLVLPGARDADSLEEAGDGDVARGAVRVDEPQRAQRHGVLPDSAQPRGGAGRPGGAVVPGSGARGLPGGASALHHPPGDGLADGVPGLQLHVHVDGRAVQLQEHPVRRPAA